MKNKYKSLNVSYKNNKFNIKLLSNSFRELKAREVLIKTKYSSINYKDALSVTGKTKIIRKESLTPGLDFSGIVIDSDSKKFKKGDKVLATGAGLGETINGGFSEFIYAPENILINIPENLTFQKSMQIGTAGVTAAIAIDKMILNKQKSLKGPIAVTGSSGGVGSFAINILNNLGFETIAMTRKAYMYSYLKKIGATRIIQYEKNSKKIFLNNQIFAGAIDNLGGEILDWLIKSTKENGNIVSIGMASNPNLNTTVFPLIMRGINILGVSSTNYKNSKRKYIWEKISKNYFPSHLKTINTCCINIEDIIEFSKKTLSGKLHGRIIIKFS